MNFYFLGEEGMLIYSSVPMLQCIVTLLVYSRFTHCRAGGHRI